MGSTAEYQGLSIARRLASVKVLIADHQSAMGDFLAELLQPLGFRDIIRATTSDEVMQAMHRHAIDIVITEWQLFPHDGLDVVRSLRVAQDMPFDCRVPVIMVTGMAEKHHVYAARDAGITEFIVKPFHVKTLLDRLVSVVEAPRNFVLTKEFSGPDRRRIRTDRMRTEQRLDTVLEPKLFLAQADRESVLQGENAALMLVADRSLKKKIGTDIDMRAILQPPVIERLQQVVSAHQPQFIAMVQQELAELEALNRWIASGGDLDIGVLQRVCALALAIKSKAGIFGYTLASDVAWQLYMYLQKPAVTEQKQRIVLKHFVEALRSIFLLSIEGDGGITGRELALSLGKLAEKYSPQDQS